MHSQTSAKESIIFFLYNILFDGIILFCRGGAIVLNTPFKKWFLNFVYFVYLCIVNFVYLTAIKLIPLH